jgi:hypothetical protein
VEQAAARRHAVQVAALFAPGYLLEAEAWALVGD